MNVIIDVLLTAILAITLENALFSRALGINRHMMAIRKPSRILAAGGLLTGITGMASALCWKLNELLREENVPSQSRPFFFLLSICIVYLLVCGGLLAAGRKRKERRFRAIVSLLPLSVFNCAVFGSILLSTTQAYHLAEFIGFGLGTGIGYTGALFLVAEGQRRLELSKVPKAFRGQPIQFLYIGLLSLAFYGLSGHQLPF